MIFFITYKPKIGGSFARTGIPQAVSSTAYNAANHQTTFSDKTLTYDNNGNLQTITDSSGTTTYTWNARNQLTGISGPGVSASFVYDGLGRREKKTINGNLTEFLLDGVNPVQETSGATVLANVLTGLGIDEFLSRNDIASSTTSFLLPDALGSSIALTDAAGAVQTEYTYEPFGKTTSSGSSNSSSYQYTGRENDDTGLYYYRARYYDPVLQRFIAEDPVDFAGGDINLYAYVLGNPVSFIDPLGLDVTVTLYSGASGFGHIGIGVNSPNTFGFYPAAEASTLSLVTGQPVPGVMHPDNRPATATITIPANSRQDQAIQEFINDRMRNPGNYDLNGRNCATTVGDALRRGGIDTPPTIFPKELMRSLQRQFGRGMGVEY